VSSDVLSDVLRAVRLTGAVYFDFDLSAPWVAEAPPSRDIAHIVMPGSQRVIEYHVIARGSCWAHAVGEAPRHLREGDLIVFPQGDAHVVSSAPGLRAKPDMAMFVRPTTPLPLMYEVGGGGDRSRIVCGFLGLDDRPFNPLLAALPPVIHLAAADVQGLSGGLRDPVVGQALAAIHGAPAEPWTVESLARTVGHSRSVFAERFMAMMGQPPMQYLALWRMQLASRHLADGGTVAEVAAAVGYDSEAAFSRAFKKLVGQSPAAWRRSR
jgi:AraC-like DNA-binding protein